jgi:glutamate synthase domain-containing protein 1
VFSELTVAHGGEITLYGEIERWLRKHDIVEPACTLEKLKQVLDAL